METAIKGFERIVQTLGFENFADYEVLSLTLDRTGGKPTFEIVIIAKRSYRLESDPSSSSWYTLRLLFHGIDDVLLEDFNQQNVIHDLVETRVDGRWKIHFAGIFGLDCSFTCDEGEVLSIEPSQLKAR